MSYANPDALVSTEWLAERVGDPNIRPIEVDQDTTHYAPGHIPQEQPYVAGHVPGALNIPWVKASNDDGTFRSEEELRELYAGVGDGEVIAYCRIGERSSLTWFVLTELLGREKVLNYDGSWTEYGSMIAVPVETGG